MSFIYCVSNDKKEELISKGYKFLKQESMQNQIVWIFEFNPKIQFEIKDNQFFISNQLNF